MKSKQFCSVCKEWLDMEVVPTGDGDEDDGVIWFRCPQCQGFLPKLSGANLQDDEDEAPAAATGNREKTADDIAGKYVCGDCNCCSMNIHRCGSDSLCIIRYCGPCPCSCDFMLGNGTNMWSNSLLLPCSCVTTDGLDVYCQCFTCQAELWPVEKVEKKKNGTPASVEMAR